MHRIRLVVRALIPQHTSQVVHARRCISSACSYLPWPLSTCARLVMLISVKGCSSTRCFTHFPEMKCPNLIYIQPSTQTMKKATHDSHGMKTFVGNGRHTAFVPETMAKFAITCGT